MAGRNAEAAKEIKSLIGTSVERVEQGTTLVDQAGATMTVVVNLIQRVTDIMSEISAGSTEQSQGVAQVREAVSQIDQVTQQNAALVEESTAAAESLKVQALALVQVVAAFKLSNDSRNVAQVAFVQVERPGPDRAKNVVRTIFLKPAQPKARAPAALVLPRAAESCRGPASCTGADDWETF